MMDDTRKQLIDNIRIAIADKSDEKEIFQAAVELIDGFNEDFNWTGFYVRKGRLLEVGPYIGPETPHKTIELNRGICGAAAVTGRTIIVDDVNSDARFLACSITTKSEIVVPLMDGDNCLGEIDIDSDKPGRFTTQDKAMLEAIAETVVTRLKQIR
ncbi:MAG: GAF domain-containing protein [candidate division Zixibacteria bacterium]|nr:GAF domain-containing protein [candidate division Zixibacteria bacterium]